MPTPVAAPSSIRFVAFDKDYVLEEIRRTAEANGGRPLGRDRFRDETGIKPGDWAGHWARWSDAVEEAGFQPNTLQGRFDEAAVLELVATETRRIGHMPTIAEWTLRRYQDRTIPSAGVYQGLGPKRARAMKLAEHLRGRSDFADVLAMIAPLLREPDATRDADGGRGEVADFGLVYLLKSGRNYKIGRTNSTGRRERELAIQLPERATLLHEIRTDDPTGIETYWHKRFADRRKNGEWFELTASDVQAFRRRKFM